MVTACEDAAAAELKVGGFLLIEPEFFTHLSNESKRRGLNGEGMEDQNDST